jgi:hypothetical protein
MGEGVPGYCEKYFIQITDGISGKDAIQEPSDE